MTIDADLLAYYDQMARKYPASTNAGTPSAQEARAQFATVAGEALRPLPAGLRSETFEIPLPGRNLRARLYRPIWPSPATAPGVISRRRPPHGSTISIRASWMHNC